MLKAHPDVFVHCGDTIYADGPLRPEVALDDGSVWRNVVTPAKSRVAETLDDFRGNYQYNLLDEHMRRFNAAVAQVVIWDDHEVRDNWHPARLDGTFGPEVRFTGIPPGMEPNRPPSEGLQFFGTLRIDARHGALTARLHDLSGRTLFGVELAPR